MKKFCIIFVTTLFCINFGTRAYARVSPEQLDALTFLIIQAESSGDPNAVGAGGERGLMQIGRATWDRFSDYPYSAAFDGEKNIQVGRFILETINEHYGEIATPARIVYSYNTGRLCYGRLPNWTRRHPNNIYRSIYNAKR